MIRGCEDSLYQIVQYMLDNGHTSPGDYTGFHSKDKKKPFIISFGKDHDFEVEFIMNERGNGDYDGLEGFNINAL